MDKHLAELVALPGPPGQEGPVRDYLTKQLDTLGLTWRVDAKGNLLCGSENPRIIVTAHLDEIALLVTEVWGEGSLSVQALGGVYPWKWGEGPVEVLPIDGSAPQPGILSFGSIHTSHAGTVVQRARDGRSLTWSDVRVLAAPHPMIIPGARVVMARSRRTLWPVGELVGSYFLDDRADLVAWLRVLELLQKEAPFPATLRVPDERPGEGLGERSGIMFAATASEELGGHGALWLLGNTRPDICLALEIGPVAPDNAVVLSAVPTAWVNDGFAPTDAQDIALIQRAALQAGTQVQFQALSRGGSDASCAAAQGLCARPITLAFPCENTHGFEILHRDALENLAQLTVEVLRQLSA